MHRAQRNHPSTVSRARIVALTHFIENGIFNMVAPVPDGVNALSRHRGWDRTQRHICTTGLRPALTENQVFASAASRADQRRKASPLGALTLCHAAGDATAAPSARSAKSTTRAAASAALTEADCDICSSNAWLITARIARASESGSLQGNDPSSRPW